MMMDTLGVNRVIGRWPRPIVCVWVLLVSSACATAPVARQRCVDPEIQLARLLQPYETLNSTGCTTAQDECERLRNEIVRLNLVCPTHAPTLMANAVIAYDQGRPIEAQQLLDMILAQPRVHPTAAVLRARIAIEEGNLPFATRLLDQQIRISPDDSALHEMYAAALFLRGNVLESRSELRIAAALGAPKWRIAYHLGLIEETAGRASEASRLYLEALQENPNWAPAQSRLKALQARPSSF